jgi:ABC-type Zn2+ transport system substrate-binding protein/surface adhesin
MDLEEVQQLIWKEVDEEEEDDNKSIDFVRIDQSEKDNSDQESIEQEEDHDQQHHLVEGAELQERNLTDWSFDGTSIDSSAGGQSTAAAELVNLRMATLMVNLNILNF